MVWLYVKGGGLSWFILDSDGCKAKEIQKNVTETFSAMQSNLDKAASPTLKSAI